MERAEKKRVIWWYEQLPHNLKPDESRCEELEKLRKRYHMPNDIFLSVLLSSPMITRRVQENAYTKAKEQMPNAPEKELLEAVFRSRVFPQNPYGLKMSEEEIRGKVRNITSLQDLITYFIEEDKEEQRFQRDIFGIGKKLAKEIDRILES